ncbi:MAG: translation initiation factor [Saprospiraceae bacterium]|nr:translation initiation factor [Saprospiraceae bacterium]
MKKTKLDSLSDLAMVFSTNKSHTPDSENQESTENSNKKLQAVRVQLNTRLKGGKSASIIYGLEEQEDVLQQICKQIKQKCGVGGSVKDGEIIIQGDQVIKIIGLLKELGYTQTKRSGG